jgi:hypothetical protein
LTVADGWASSQCTATVNVLDYSVQDNTSGDYLLFNSTNGAYFYHRCSSGLTLTGTGAVTVVGCTVRMTVNNSTQRITLSLDKCKGTATATVTTISPAATYTMADGKTGDNTNACKGG